MATTDGPDDPVEAIDDGGVERPLAPLPAHEVEVDPDAEAEGSGLEQSQQAQQ